MYDDGLLEYWKQQVHGLVGIVPGKSLILSLVPVRPCTELALGLKHVDVGAPLPSTAEKAKGFDVSLVAILEKPEDALVYAEHPAHERYAINCPS